MRKTLRRMGKAGLALLILNEIRGALMVAGVISGWAQASPGSAHETAGAALVQGLKCGLLLACGGG